MGLKEIIFFAALVVLVPVGTVAGIASRRVREVAFFVLVFGTAIVKSADINFLSREWYRGSTVGIEISALDFLCVILIASSLLASRPSRPRFFWPASLGPMLLYASWCVLSVVQAEPQLFGVFELTKIARGMLLFVAIATFVREPRDLAIFAAALALVGVFEGATALRDRYLFGMYRIGATLGHPNSLSLYCCMLTPVLISAALARLSWLLRLACAAGAISALVCVLLTVSRTGAVTIVAVSLGALFGNLGLRITPKRLAIGALVVLAVGGMFYKASDSIAGRFSERSLEMEYSDEGTEGRGVYFRLAEAIYRDKPLGVGLNNWSYAVSNVYGPPEGFAYNPYLGTDTVPDREVPYGSKLDAAQAAPAHNLLALTLGELGVVGVAFLLLLWLRWLSLGVRFFFRRSEVLASRLGVGLFFGVGAAFMQSWTEWIFRQTNIFFLFHVFVGVLAALVWARRHGSMEERGEAEGDESGGDEPDSVGRASTGLPSERRQSPRVATVQGGNPWGSLDASPSWLRGLA